MPHKRTGILKLFSSATLTLTLFVLFPTKAWAQPAWFVPTATEHAAALRECEGGEVGLECTVQAIVTAINNSLTYGTGGDPYRAGRPGALHFASAMLSKILATPPVSSGDYVQYLAQRLQIAQPAYAQGAGFQALQPLIPIWAAFRNIAYLAFVVIFILIGFMIMFRARLDPQTVVNVQNALPKLVVTLLLITFSYAIAGLMVDIIYLGIYLLVSVFASQGLISAAPVAREKLIGHNLFSLVFGGGIFRAAGTANEAIEGIIRSVIDYRVGAWLLDFISEPFVHVIFSLALLFSVFRLFFQLLIAYVQILLATILAPILLLFNALPGSGSFGNWVRNFLANVLIFPAVAALFLVSAVLMGPCDACPFGDWGVTRSLIEEQALSEGEGWLPPFIGFTVDTQDVISLVGYGFILFAPQMVAVLQKSLKAQPLPVAGVFAPIAAGAAVAAAPFRGTGGAIGTGARVYFGEKIERLARRGEVGGGKVG